MLTYADVCLRTLQVSGGSLDEVAVTSGGTGYTIEEGLQVVVASGGAGCEGVEVVARLQSIRLAPSRTTVVLGKVGREALQALANATAATRGQLYAFSLEVVSDAGASEARVLENVALLAAPQVLSLLALWKI
jgi:hypothetical protein